MSHVSAADATRTLLSYQTICHSLHIHIGFDYALIVILKTALHSKWQQKENSSRRHSSQNSDKNIRTITQLIMGITKPSNEHHLLFSLLPAIRHASWYGGSSQYCPCVCMPSQQGFVFFHLFFSPLFIYFADDHSSHLDTSTLSLLLLLYCKCFPNQMSQYNLLCCCAGPDCSYRVKGHV